MAAVLFYFIAGAFVISVRSFKQKGFLFNNAYLYASKQERDTMDKSNIIASPPLYFCWQELYFY